MKCLVVTTHPLADSLCAHLTELTVSELDSMGHVTTVENLYSGNFDPALSMVERQTYYSLAYDSANFANQRNSLQEAEALVLLFPTWWFGFPAMLKGWFDRVWGPGIAFDHSEDYGPITAKLDNLREVLVITTLGSPWWVDRLVMRQPVKRVLKVALLGTCAKNSKLTFLSLYSCEKTSERTLNRFGRKIKNTLSGWK